MTVFEAADVIELLKDFYPVAYAKRTEAELMRTATHWASIFAEDDVRLVVAALKAFITSDEKGFPPAPGQIKAKMNLITDSDELSEAEAWNLIAKAIRNSGYNAQEEFKKLPPILQKLVGSPNQLKEWGNMDSETVHSVVASNVQRAFRTVAERERIYRSLTPDVRELLTAFAAARAMPELSQDEQDKLPTKPAETLPPCGTDKPGGGKMPENVRKLLDSMRAGQTRTPEIRPATPRVQRNRAEMIEALKRRRSQEREAIT